jgi:hypothetical protein
MNKYDGHRQDKTANTIDEIANKLKTVEDEMDKEITGGNEQAVKVTPMEIAKSLLVKRTLKGGRMGIDDDLCNTNLISKDYSPMFIRKFNAKALHNWPLYVSMICDEDVSDIDSVVNGALKAADEAGLLGNNLQNMRNLTGIISETLSTYYNNKKENCVEGIAVTLYIDKAYIQSLSGDFMNHAQCRSEYTQALMMMTQI